MVATPAYVTKSSLCESLGCALRDLRVIDQFNGRYSGPAFLARSNCVIVNVGHVRAIVMREQVLIFLPEASCNVNSGFTSQMQEHQSDPSSSSNASKNTSHVQETIEKLVDALVTYLNAIYHSSYNLGYDDEGHETHLKSKGDTFGGQNWRWMSASAPSVSSRDKAKRVKNEPRIHEPKGQAPPFELVVIEALLGHVCSYESSKVTKLISSAQSVLNDITCNNDIGTKRSQKRDAFLEMQIKLGELLPLKNKIDSLEAKCTEVSAAIEEVLKNDEDMAAMRLSAIEAGKGVLEGDPDNLHVEVELLFEDYLLQMDEVLLSLRSMQSTVRNTEEVVEIELDLLRNRIMRYEMLIELSGLVVGVAAAVTGGFGMNLLSGLEEHPTMFWDVAKGLCIIMIALAWGILRKLASDNIL
jgi:Mg2+ and Co2+ transporter CorA